MTISKIVSVLGDINWMDQNTKYLKQIIPSTWTHHANVNGAEIGRRLRTIGVLYDTQEEFSKILSFFERIGLLEQQGDFIRVNADFTFNPGLLGP